MPGPPPQFPCFQPCPLQAFFFFFLTQQSFFLKSELNHVLPLSHNLCLTQRKINSLTTTYKGLQIWPPGSSVLNNSQQASCYSLGSSLLASLAPGPLHMLFPCLECPYPRNLHGSLPHLIWGFTWRIPFQWGLSWPPFQKKTVPPLLPMALPVLFFFIVCNNTVFWRITVLLSLFSALHWHYYWDESFILFPFIFRQRFLPVLFISLDPMPVHNGCSPNLFSWMNEGIINSWISMWALWGEKLFSS